MITYITLFYLPLSIKLFSKIEIKNYLRFLFMFLLVLIIGLRHEIGGDFFAYVNAGRVGGYYRTIDDTLLSLIYLISYEYLFFGIYGVQLICAIIFIISLNIFLSSLKDYELGLIIFIPVGIIIGAMGYVSQTLALSFGMLAINSINKKQFVSYLIFVLLGILSHISGLFFLIFSLAYFKFNIQNIIKVSIIGIIFFLILYLLNKEEIDRNIYYYLGAGKHLISLGALPRYFFSIISSLLFLFYIRKRIVNSNLKKVNTIFSLLVIILLPLIFSSSTFVDRINLYLIPFQAYVFTTFISLLEHKYIKRLINSVVIILYGSSLLVWLVLGSHSKHWLPYKIFPFQYCISDNFNEYFCEYFSYEPNIIYEELQDYDLPR